MYQLSQMSLLADSQNLTLFYPLDYKLTLNHIVVIDAKFFRNCSVCWDNWFPTKWLWSSVNVTQKS